MRGAATDAVRWARAPEFILCLESGLEHPSHVASEASASPVLTPLRFNCIELGDRGLDELLSVGGQANQPGATIGGVWAPFEVSPLLKRGDEFAHRLMGHVCPRRQHAQPSPVGVEILEHGVVRRRHVRVPSGLQALDELAHHEPRGTPKNRNQAGTPGHNGCLFHTLTIAQESCVICAGSLYFCRGSVGFAAWRPQAASH